MTEPEKLIPENTRKPDLCLQQRKTKFMFIDEASFNTIVEMKEEMGVQDVDYQERFPQTPVCMEWCV